MRWHRRSRTRQRCAAGPPRSCTSRRCSRAAMGRAQRPRSATQSSRPPRRQHDMSWAIGPLRSLLLRVARCCKLCVRAPVRRCYWTSSCQTPYASVCACQGVCRAFAALPHARSSHSFLCTGPGSSLGTLQQRPPQGWLLQAASQWRGPNQTNDLTLKPCNWLRKCRD